VKIDLSKLLLFSQGAVDQSGAVKRTSNASWKERFEQAESQTASTLRANSLLQGFDRRLKAFELALDRFQWPEKDFPWSESRLAVKENRLKDKIETSLKYGDEIKSYYRAFSRGFDQNQEHDLDNGEYELNLSLGNKTETLELEITDEDQCWGDVLEKAALAVNQADLPVQAEIATQSGPSQRIDGLLKTGSVLALSVNPAYKSQDLKIDARDSLARGLDFDPAMIAASGPKVETYNLKGLSRARPTLVSTDVFDPEETTSLAQGTHYIDYLMGPNSGTVGVNLDSGDTWDQALNKIAQAVNSSQSYFTARVEEAERPVYVESGGDISRIEAEGVRLSFEAADPKLDFRLSLSQGSSPLAALSFYDPSGGLPDAIDGRTYIASADNAGEGWSENNIYAYDGLAAQWVETVPTTGDIYSLSSPDADYRFDGTSWSQAQDLISVIGADRTAFPGADGRISAASKEYESATGLFSLDKGALELELESVFGDALPLRIVESLDELSLRTESIIQEYNGLIKFMQTDPAAWREGLAQSFRKPFADKADDLAWLGLEEYGRDKQVWANGDTFLAALFQDPDRAEGLLVKGEGSFSGLVTEWKDLASSIRSEGLDSVLAQATSLDSTTPPWRKQLDNEEDERLLDLFG